MSLVSLKIVNTLKVRKSSVTVSFSPIYVPETITGLFLFQCLQSLSNNKHINIRSLLLTKHYSFAAQNKHRREYKQY